MNGQGFLRITAKAFSPFLKELGFVEDEPAISGRFYRASYTGRGHVVSVTYESGDNAIFVLVFSRRNGEISDVDDRINTLRLSDLNRCYLAAVTNKDRVENQDFFRPVTVLDEDERLLLKTAKDLRLVLPKHLRP